MRVAQATDAALAKKIEEIAPAEVPAVAVSEFGFGPPPPLPPATLANVAAQLVGAVMPMQGAEMGPTEAQLAGYKNIETAYVALMAKWAALKR